MTNPFKPNDDKEDTKLTFPVNKPAPRTESKPRPETREQRVEKLAAHVRLERLGVAEGLPDFKSPSKDFNFYSELESAYNEVNKERDAAIKKNRETLGLPTK